MNIISQSLSTASSLPENGTGNFVNSVNKALRILECFTTTQKSLTLAQISRMLGIPKSTVLNLIRTLEINGYLLHIADTQSYQLGYKLMGLSYNLRASLPIIQFATPFLEELQVKTGENIYLTSHIDGKVFYLEGIYPSIRIGNYSVAGKQLPLHCTACGKSMMAYLPEDELEQVIKQWGLPQITQNTITDYPRLMEEFKSIRQQGYAKDLEEETLGVKCIAMAIRDCSGYPTGAISISGTMISMRDELLEEYAKFLSRICSVLISYAHQFPAAQIRALR